MQEPGDGDLYSKLKGKLTDYFSPKKNIHYSRYLFLKMRPHIGESTIAYAALLREKAVNCEFHDCDERILEHIIQTSDNSELIRKVLHKKWTLQQTLAEVIRHFPAPIFPDLTMPGYPQKASYFEHRLCHKIFSGEDWA